MGSGRSDCDFSDLPGRADDAYAVVDERGVVTSWSPGAQRLLGYGAGEVCGHSGVGLLGERGDARRLVLPREGAVALGEVRLRHRDGTPVEFALWAQRLECASGGWHWLLRGDSADTVRRRDLGYAVLRALFTDSPFLIDVFDTRLRFLAQNDAQSRAAGFPDDFFGRTMREIAPSGLLDLEALEARQRQVLTTGRALVSVEVRGRTPDDPDRDHIWSETIVPLRSRSGAVIGLAHAVFDASEQVRGRERLALINDASTRIGSTLDVLCTAQELTDIAVPRFADLAYVNLLDPVFGGDEPTTGPVDADVALRRAASSTIPEGPAGTGVATGAADPFAAGAGNLVARTLRSGESLLLTGEELYAELRGVDPARAALVRAHGVHSWLLVPMYARGAALGAVVFMRFKRVHPFERDDVLLGEELAARAAVCIDNASRYTREQTKALALQRSLLPQRLPVLGAVETCSRYLPARGHAVLSGDWFDVVPLSSARVALVVGDVRMEGGVHAAVTMGRLRTAVRTLADLEVPPEEVLDHLDDQVNRFQDERGGRLAGAAAGTVACLYAVYDPVSRRCALAQAGHPPPLRVTSDGRAELLGGPGGPPLGLGGAPFESHETPLEDGDLLVLFSDSLVETPERSGDAGLALLRTVLSDPELSSSPKLDDICDAVLQWMLPTPPQDGVALLLARVHGLTRDRHASWDLAAVPEIVGRARALAARKLAEWGLEELTFATELVVSELVTNAVRYGSPPIRLRLIRDRGLVCEVSDSSSTSPHIRRALETDEGGRGLYLVAQVVQLWGTRYHARGKTIWAEQPFPDGLEVSS
jgi:PAS domain S-box-containing protein